MKAGKFDEFSKTVPSKVEDVLDCEIIMGVISHAGERVVQAFVESEIVKLSASVNINQALNIKDHQVPMIAEMLIADFKWESLEDLVLCFRRGSMGKYGEIYRLDVAVLGFWMTKYLDEKYNALEARIQKEKKETKVRQVGNTVDGSKYIQEWLEAIGAPVEEEKNNRKENEYQRTKMAYKPQDEEQIRKHDLHLQWIKENTDLKTGEITGVDEQTWLKNKGL